MATDLVPLPGNPTMLRVAADEHLDTAESIRDAASSLRALASRIRTRSQAVDVVRDVADDVSDLIVKADIRYTGTALALRTYSFALETAQSRANNAIAATANSQSELNTARYYMADAEERAQRDTPERLQAIEDYGRWKQRVRDLEGQIGAAEGDYVAAVNDLNDAAQVAISAINVAIEKSGLNDSILDRMREAWDAFVEFWEEYVAPILSIIQTLIEQIAKVLAVVALILAFIPGMQAIAGALLLVVLALNGLSLLLTAVLMLTGDRSLGDLIRVAVDVALSAIPVAGGAAAIAATAGKHVVKHLAIEIAKEIGTAIVVEVLVEDFLLDLEQVGAAIESGNWEDLPMPGLVTLPPQLNVEFFGLIPVTIDIPFATGDVPTVGDALEFVGNIDPLDALVSVGAEFPVFSISPIAPVR